MIGILGVAFIIMFFVLIALTVIIKLFDGEKILVLGKKDKRELIFGLFYFLLLYIILSNETALPMPEAINAYFWHNTAVRIIGVGFCALGTIGYIICTINFWQSVRIGVDYEHAGKLTTTGIYAVSRNPMYVSFLIIFFGEFLIFPNIGLALAVVVAGLSFHVQILKEEKFLKSHYGQDYAHYCSKVRRYL